MNLIHVIDSFRIRKHSRVRKKRASYNVIGGQVGYQFNFYYWDFMHSFSYFSNAKLLIHLIVTRSLSLSLLLLLLGNLTKNFF